MDSRTLCEFEIINRKLDFIIERLSGKSKKLLKKRATKCKNSECGELFFGLRSTAKFCSEKCRNKFHNSRESIKKKKRKHYK